MTVVRSPAPAPPALRGWSSPRNTELRLLLLAVVTVAGYAAVAEMHLLGELTATFWVHAGVVGAVFVGAHIAVRIMAPYADPVLLPTAALLNGVGVAFLRRLDLAVPAGDQPVFSGIGGQQLLWTLISLLVAVGLLALVRDHRMVSYYAWTLGLVALILMILPGLLPASISASVYDESARQWIRLGPISIQPGEFAKLALAAFFAYYLVRKREVLALASKRFLGIDFPRGRDLGPVVVVWLMSMMVLVWQFDLGMSLTYLGLFVAMLYIATERVSWLIIGFLLFAGGAVSAYLLGSTVGGPFRNLANRVDVWLDPFADPTGGGFQPVQGLLALGSGGLFGVGPGAGHPRQIPEVQNDYIFAGIGEELGLFGLTVLLAAYLLLVTRGIRAGLAVRDSFGKLFAGGLTFTLGLQVFIILGGVGGLIPLTGLTTPFMSAGGSALMASWILVAMLLRISDSARRPPPTGGGLRVPPPVAAAPAPAAAAAVPMPAMPPPSDEPTALVHQPAPDETTQRVAPPPAPDQPPPSDETTQRVPPPPPPAPPGVVGS